eukprot:908407-Prymnesium_polylepis.2
MPTIRRRCVVVDPLAAGEQSVCEERLAEPSRRRTEQRGGLGAPAVLLWPVSHPHHRARLDRR